MTTPLTTLPTIDTSAPIKFTEDELGKDINASKKTEKELQKKFEEIKKQFAEVDKILLEHATKWMEHLEDFIKELAEQLEANGVALTAEEKAELRSGLTTITEIRERIKKLKKRNLEIADNAGYYIVVTYDAIVTALSRLLQRIDNASIKGIVKKLNILEKERNDAKTMVAAQAEQYGKIITAVQKLKEEVAKIALPLTENKATAVTNYIQAITKPITKEITGPEVKAVLE